MKWLGNALVEMLAGIVMLVITLVLQIIFAFGMFIFFLLFLGSELYRAVRARLTQKTSA